MLNQVVLVGRLTNDITKETIDGKERATATIAIPRSYKNENGAYDNDYVELILWNSVATNTAEYCRKGDMIGAKGRLETEIIDNKSVIKVVVEKVTFLSSKPKDEE